MTPGCYCNQLIAGDLPVHLAGVPGVLMVLQGTGAVAGQAAAAAKYLVVTREQGDTAGSMQQLSVSAAWCFCCYHPQRQALRTSWGSPPCSEWCPALNLVLVLGAEQTYSSTPPGTHIGSINCIFDLSYAVSTPPPPSSPQSSQAYLPRAT